MSRNRYAITYSDAGSVLKLPGGLFKLTEGNLDISAINAALGTFPVTDFRLIAVTISSTSDTTAAVEWSNGLTVQTDYTLKPIRVKPMKLAQESFWHENAKNDNTLVDIKGRLDYVEIAVRFKGL